MAVRGKIGIEELQPAILKDPEIQRLSRATTIVESEHYTKISTGKRWADVTLYLTDGQVLKSRPYTPRGDPDDPLPDEEISAKFHLFTDRILGKPRADSTEAMVAKPAADMDLKALLMLIFPPP